MSNPMKGYVISMLNLADLPELIRCAYTLDGETYYVHGQALCLREVRGGGYCEKVAGTGTAHPYKGPCYQHDPRVHSPHITTGEYSTVAKHRLREQIKKFEENPWENLYAEQALLRALLARAVEKFRGTRVDEDRILRLARSIQGITESINSINRDNVLTVMAAKFMMARAMEVASKYITDPVDLQAFLHEWRRDVMQQPESPLATIENIEAGKMLLADNPKMVTDGFERVVVEGSKLKRD